MAIKDRLKAIGKNIRQDEATDEARATILRRARAVLQNSENPRARQRAREILARAEPGTGAGTVDSRKKSRTQRMFERAERTATIAPPIEATVDPTPDPQAMWAFGMAGTQQGEPAEGETAGATPGVSAELPLGHMGEMAMIDADALLFSVGPDPDWEDNPADLDTPDEVREDLRDSGLNPMNVGTEEDAMFGHFLVHAFEDDEDLGGRTAAQLEAEHDLTVQAMADFGVGHHSPLDRGDIGDGSLDFDDAWGLMWGDE